MSYVIYNINTTELFVHPGSREFYWNTERGAKMIFTKAKLELPWAISERSFFHSNIEKQVTKTNLMSGKQFTQPANTPLCCDPSSETYWSM